MGNVRVSRSSRGRMGCRAKGREAPRPEAERERRTVPMLGTASSGRERRAPMVASRTAVGGGGARRQVDDRKFSRGAQHTEAGFRCGGWRWASEVT